VAGSIRDSEDVFLLAFVVLATRCSAVVQTFVTVIRAFCQPPHYTSIFSLTTHRQLKQTQHKPVVI